MLKGKRLMHGRSSFETELLLAVEEVVVIIRPEIAVQKAAGTKVAHALVLTLVS
jgi:hypothetical protein